MDDILYITFTMYTKRCVCAILFPFPLPGGWIKVVIAGAGAALLDHQVEVLH